MGGGSSFSTLVHLTLGFAGTWAIVELISKRSLSVSMRWFAAYFVAFYVVFLPKATIDNIDRVAQDKVYTVDNVPGTLYGAFVFVFLLLMFPFGFAVLKHYAFALIWLQLWAPLYAMINLYSSYYAQQHSLAAITLSGGAQALSLSTQSGLAQVNMDMAGLAGYIS